MALCFFWANPPNRRIQLDESIKMKINDVHSVQWCHNCKCDDNLTK